MTEKDIEKMLNENCDLDMSHVKKDDILAKAKQELSSPATTVKEEKKSFFEIFTSKRLIPVVAGVACAFTLFVGAIGLYNENYQTIYIDVNPSIALTLNRFDRVIEVKYLNDDAKNLLADTDLVGSNIEVAVQTVITTCDKAGFVKEDSEIYISATSKEEEKSEQLLNKLKTNTQSMKPSNPDKEDETYAVSTYNTKKEEKEKFEKSDISPAKDKIIREISDEDENYKPKDLKDKSMYELSHIKKNLHKHDDDDFDKDDDEMHKGDKDHQNDNFEDDRKDHSEKDDKDDHEVEDDDRDESEDRDDEDKNDDHDEEFEEDHEDRENNKSTEHKPNTNKKPENDNEHDSKPDDDQKQNEKHDENKNGKENGNKDLEEKDDKDIDDDRDDNDDDDDNDDENNHKPQTDKKTSKK